MYIQFWQFLCHYFFTFNFLLFTILPCHFNLTRYFFPSSWEFSSCECKQEKNMYSDFSVVKLKYISLFYGESNGRRKLGEEEKVLLTE